jgi:hypothetical protein
MSGRDRGSSRADRMEHERARSLASDAIDIELSAADAAWLAEHLESCGDCRAAAEGYRTLHEELRALPLPEPPRDLWARTAVGLDTVDRERAARARRSARAPRDWLAPRRSGLAFGRRFVPVAAVALAIVVAGVALVYRAPGQAPGSPPGSSTHVAASPSATAQQAAVAVVGGNGYWISPQGGVYEIKGGSAQCTTAATNCAVVTANGEVLGSVASTSAVSIVISPSALNAAVWTDDKVVILPLATNPATVSLDLLTPRPTVAPTPTAVVTPTPAPQATQTPLASAAPSEEPSVAATLTEGPSAAATAPIETPTAAPTETPTPAPTAPPATPAPTAAAVNQPTAILDGYRVVGRAPEFSSDGQWVAFSARPSGQKSGSDVFVWHVGWERAQAVTNVHADLFAGWLGATILISAFHGYDGNAAVPGSPTTALSYIYDPLTDAIRRIERPMLMPVVDPTGRYVVYWSGGVRFDASTGLWGPGQGDLYFDTWASVLADQLTATPVPTPVATPAESAAPTDSDGASESSATPASTEPASTEPAATEPASTPAALPTSAADDRAGLPQLVPLQARSGKVASWVVRWDASGRYVAIWAANGSSEQVGQVTLFSVIPGRDLLNISGTLLSAPARNNIAFDGTQFVYTQPAQGGDGKTYLFALPANLPEPSPSGTPTPTSTPELGETPLPSAAS